VRVVVVAEFYPRAADPVLGVWAHRQATAARDAGAEVRVLVLHRPVPPARSLRERDWRALRVARPPRRATLDGLAVEYVPFLAPARSRSYGSWGAWAAPTLALALHALRRRFPYDLVHAHYAVPAADAVLRDNIFGLEIDARCTQIAAFALALAAWKASGYHELPIPNVACSGIPVQGSGRHGRSWRATIRVCVTR